MRIKYFKIFASIIIAILLLSSCQHNRGADIITDGLSTTRYSDITNYYFEETPCGHRARSMNKNDIVSSHIQNSINSRAHSPGYYQYIHTDPATWHMFIYHAPPGGLHGYYSFRFSVVASVVHIYVVADDSSATFFSDYMLIMVQAPRGIRRASTSALYINGVPIEKQDTTFVGT